MAANFERVSLAQLQPWSVIPEHEQDDPLTHSNINFQPRFAVDTDINSKVFLWDGNIFALEVEAIVNSTNESLSDKSGLCEVLFRLAGPQLQSELALLEGCRTGESKITKAYGLPCTSHVIHTVGPRYNLKYKTAAENALHNCYRSVLQVLIENKLRTVAYCVINSPKRGYPRAEAAHVALRTVRRFLEKWGADVGAVVFAMNNLEDYESYRDTMRLYFPRNNRDLIESVDKFPEDIDETNEFGAKVIKEREIRINAFPIGELAPPEEPAVPTERALISSRPKAEINNAGLRAFMTPVADTPDDRVIQQSQQKTAAQLEAERIDRLYIKLLHQAKQEDLSEIAKRNCVFQSGVDTLGRPVIVFVGARFPEKKNKVLVEKFLKYIIRTLDPLIGQEFILVHFHANISQPQEPEFAWLKMVYKICDRKYIKWVKNFYIVHPSLWVKFTLGLLSPFMKATFTGKTVQVKSLSELFARVEQEAFSLKIPSFVYKYDRKENGSSYMGAEDTPANEGL